MAAVVASWWFCPGLQADGGDATRRAIWSGAASSSRLQPQCSVVVPFGFPGDAVGVGDCRGRQGYMAGSGPLQGSGRSSTVIGAAVFSSLPARGDLVADLEAVLLGQPFLDQESLTVLVGGRQALTGFIRVDAAGASHGASCRPVAVHTCSGPATLSSSTRARVREEPSAGVGAVHGGGAGTSGGESRTGQPLGRLPDPASLVHVAQRGPQRLLGGGAADVGSVRAVELAAPRVGAGRGQ